MALACAYETVKYMLKVGNDTSKYLKMLVFLEYFFRYFLLRYPKNQLGPSETEGFGSVFVAGFWDL